MRYEPILFDDAGDLAGVTAAAPALSDGKLLLSEQYSLLRGAIAQLSGALLVYRNASAFSADAVAALAASAAERARDGLAAVIDRKVLQANPPIARACLGAAALLDRAAAIVAGSLRAGGGGLHEAETALLGLRRAYALLAAAASERDGCTMIAFDSCCCCVPGAKVAGRV
ncbi:hypothetical protein FRZ61_43930 [Hypericibacter adhaerens]|jgi:hypothetical protein|uniref:Uncharacterized protein n=1 Tax=Hypericibacter adhaerens TaxID=2602016 RepID=A0A5J6N381_9PROT|nr:hypothetical protein [Hypericibacter adhaerens]QEX24452.1 hypothetical protein FRZ61_43930 [Hypericibacter adhaerens]